MSDLIDISAYPVRNVINILLQDKTTKKNIIWATDAYDFYGCNGKRQITIESLLGEGSVKLQPRILKSLEEQQQRTRKKAEVFSLQRG